MNMIFMYTQSIPYIVLDFVRLSCFSAGHVTLMLVIKKGIHLGELIIRCIIGGFILLFLFYLWYCTLSFYVIVGIVKSKTYKKLLALHSNQVLYNRELSSEQTKNIAIMSTDSRSKVSVTPMHEPPRYDEKPDINNMFIKEFSGFRKYNDYFIKY